MKTKERLLEVALSFFRFTLSESEGSHIEFEILTCTCVRCKCRFAQNDMALMGCLRHPTPQNELGAQVKL